MTVEVKIENTYEDGYESVLTFDVVDPESTEEESPELEQWWEDEVFPLTGDGHGAKHPKLGAWYEATVTAADQPELVGRSREWG